ncbi:DUF2171 domain-containing protein [Sphingomonas sp.]|uniref:DUF2171 domain-containing protein n=1 Tax=Sphingomonas sp. TaxID=28214 RepID=UPI002D7E7967|nr:DUF2171 domain-containing protein [Sphingomonas sp.]HEU0043871.1 DUF2171 domain-containing protein [Sphingomonas sp.]
MAYERNTRGGDRDDFYGGTAAEHYGAGRDGYGRDYGRQAYGRQEFGGEGYEQGDRPRAGDRDGQRGWNSEDRRRGYDGSAGDRGSYERSHGARDLPAGDRWRRVGVYGAARDEDRGDGRDAYRQQRGSYSRQPQDHDDDRGFLARAGDEVRSWYGDEEAERRREADARHSDHETGRSSYGRDEHYHSWRAQQLSAFDRDYHEYRQENQAKFHSEFAVFRSERQGQRDLLAQVTEHAEVVGSDGQHVGTVDKVRGDRIVLTKNDADAGGRHHSIPSRWLQSADGGKVVLRKTASEAQQHWPDEEREEQGDKGLFGDRDERQLDEG